jgi:hypothetical protein
VVQKDERSESNRKQNQSTKAAGCSSRAAKARPQARNRDTCGFSSFFAGGCREMARDGVSVCFCERYRRLDRTASDGYRGAKMCCAIGFGWCFLCANGVGTGLKRCHSAPMPFGLRVEIAVGV